MKTPFLLLKKNCNKRIESWREKSVVVVVVVVVVVYLSYKCFPQWCSILTPVMAHPQLPYALLASIRRRIPKFNVEGTEYTLSIPPIQQDGLSFDVVSAMVHDVFARE